MLYLFFLDSIHPSSVSEGGEVGDGWILEPVQVLSWTVRQSITALLYQIEQAMWSLSFSGNLKLIFFL